MGFPYIRARYSHHSCIHSLWVSEWVGDVVCLRYVVLRICECLFLQAARERIPMQCNVAVAPLLRCVALCFAASSCFLSQFCIRAITTTVIAVFRNKLLCCKHRPRHDPRRRSCWRPFVCKRPGGENGLQLFYRYVDPTNKDVTTLCYGWFGCRARRRGRWWRRRIVVAVVVQL